MSRNRRQAGVELALLLGALLLHVWTDSPAVASQTGRTAGSVLLAAVAIGVLIAGRLTRRDFGFAPDSLADGVRSLVVFTVLAATAMLAVGAAAGTLAVPRDYGHWLLRQALPLSLGQQLLLQVAIAPRVARLGYSERTTPLVAALLFAAVHLPNPILFALTFLAGWRWTRWFALHRNMLPLWVSHALLAATCFAAFDGGDWLRRMRVGAGWIYFFTNP